MKATAIAFSLLLLTPACISQQPKAPPKDPFVVQAGEVSLTELIDRCATYLDCNILTSPQELANSGQGGSQVRLQKAISTDQAGCEEFLAGILYRNGLSLTQLSPQGPTLEVISMNGPRGREITNRAVGRTPEQVMARPDLKVMVVTVVPLKNINATIATNALRPFFASVGSPQGGGTLTIGNVGNSASMLLLGMQDQVAQAIRLLQACDLPGTVEGMPMPAPQTERIAALEARVKALEEQVGKAKTPGGDTKR